MQRAFQMCLILIVLVTIGTAQLFGAQGGYLCLDQGRLLKMAAEHCHQATQADSSGNARNGEAHNVFTPCASSAAAGCADEDGTSSHPSLKVTSLSPTGADTIAAPGFIPATMPADLAAFAWLLALATPSLTEAADAPESPEPPLSHRAASLLVAECTVLLI